MEEQLHTTEKSTECHKSWEDVNDEQNKYNKM